MTIHSSFYAKVLWECKKKEDEDWGTGVGGVGTFSVRR